MLLCIWIYILQERNYFLHLLYFIQITEPSAMKPAQTLQQFFLPSSKMPTIYYTVTQFQSLAPHELLFS